MITCPGFRFMRSATGRSGPSSRTSSDTPASSSSANFWRASGSGASPDVFCSGAVRGSIEKRLGRRDLQHAGVFAASQVEGQADQGLIRGLVGIVLRHQARFADQRFHFELDGREGLPGLAQGTHHHPDDFLQQAPFDLGQVPGGRGLGSALAAQQQLQQSEHGGAVHVQIHALVPRVEPEYHEAGGIRQGGLKAAAGLDREVLEAHLEVRAQKCRQSRRQAGREPFVDRVKGSETRAGGVRLAYFELFGAGRRACSEHSWS